MSGVLLAHGDARRLPLADQSVQCCITSPPYYSLRDYNCAGQLGLEALHDCLAWARGEPPCGTCYVCALRTVASSYAGGGGFSASAPSTQTSKSGKYGLQGALKPGGIRGLPPKNLCGIPWRVALALQADGWILRSEIIWAKPNPMPESVTDRVTRSHEQLFMLSKQPRYFFDAIAVQECTTSMQGPRPFGGMSPQRKNHDRHDYVYQGDTGTRNARSVLTLPTEAFSGSHFAVMPSALVAFAVKAGTSAAGCCPACGVPWVRQVEVGYTNPGNRTTNGPRSLANRHQTAGFAVRLEKQVDTTGFAPGCRCNAGPAQPCTVFDPFVGSGTVPLVARALGRHGVGLDLSWPYLTLARARLDLTALQEWTQGAPPRATSLEGLPLFAQES